MNLGAFRHEQLNIAPSSEFNLCLSLTQPYASALFIPGLKTIETRSWRTHYRGRIYIHAAKNFPRWAKEFLHDELGHDHADLPIGQIIGHVELVDIKRSGDLVDRISDKEKRWGDYGLGRYGWIFANPVLLPAAIPAKGSLGLWKVSRNLVGAAA